MASTVMDIVDDRGSPISISASTTSPIRLAAI
jgi:hypothetical protein